MENENNLLVTNNAVLVQSVETPLLLKIVSLLMWIEGIFLVILGVPLIILLGLGILFINLGISITKYARGVYRLERNTYKKALVVQVVFALFWLADLTIGKFSIKDGLYSLVPILAFLIIYSYRNQFTNEILLPVNNNVTSVNAENSGKESYFAITKRKAILSIVLAVIGGLFAGALILTGADAGVPAMLVIAFIMYPPLSLVFGLSFLHVTNGFIWIIGLLLELLYVHIILSTIILVKEKFHKTHNDMTPAAIPHDHDIGKKTLYAVVVLIVLLVSSPFLIGGFKLLQTKYLSNSSEAQNYNNSKMIDLKTWKSFTSRENFFTLQYPSWWIPNTGSGLLSAADTDEWTDYFYDSNNYGDFKNMKYISVNTYVGFKDGGQSNAQDYINNMTATTTLMLDAKIPAIEGMYKNAFGYNMPVVVTTQPFNGVTFVITDTEPQGALDNLPIFNQLVSSIQINDASTPGIDIPK